MPVGAAADRNVRKRDRVPGAHGTPEAFVQRGRETLARHGEHVPVRLARRRLEVAARLAAHVENVPLLTHQDRGRGIPGKQQTIGGGLQRVTGRLPGSDHGRLLLVRGGAEHRRKRGNLGTFRHGQAPIHPPLVTGRCEERRGRPDRFRAAEQQDAALAQRVVEQRDHLALQFGGQVDEQVATADDIEPRERRVHHDVLRREDHHLADLRAHAIAAVGLHEPAIESLRRHIGGDVHGIHGESRAGDGVIVEVGGEDLHHAGSPLAEFLEHLAKHHGERVRLLAGGAGHDPRAQPRLERARPDEGRQHLPPHRLPHGRIAEEARDPDQQFLEQQRAFGGVLAHVPHVVVDAREMVQADPALDATRQRAELVLREVVPGLAAQQQHDLLDAGALRIRECTFAEQAQRRRVPQVVDDGRVEGVRRRSHIGEARLHHALRHGIEARRRRLLHEHCTGTRLDRAHAQGAIGAHAGEHDRDAERPAVVCQRAEEPVDRQPQPTRRRGLHEVQHIAQDLDVPSGRNHVDVIGLHRHAVGDLFDDERRDALQQLHQQRGLRGVEVLDHDEGVAAVRRHRREELLERLETTCRGADRNDRAQQGVRLGCVGRRALLHRGSDRDGLTDSGGRTRPCPLCGLYAFREVSAMRDARCPAHLTTHCATPRPDARRHRPQGARPRHCSVRHRAGCATWRGVPRPCDAP